MAGPCTKVALLSGVLCRTLTSALHGVPESQQADLDAPKGANDSLEASRQMVLRALGRPQPASLYGKGHLYRPGEARECSQIRILSQCERSQAVFGLTCRGWGGTHCVPAVGGKCSDVRQENICRHANVRLGLACNWSSGMCKSL
mmetsp:Transcript_80984/g.188134  ORF Transcript_80984/g.188134 Transcript_80984/m.188134 type:complete len:145 (+) Transcript_80984:58-492(+)